MASSAEASAPAAPNTVLPPSPSSALPAKAGASAANIPIYKVLVVGEPHVGKTSLVLRYSQNKVPANYKMTIGVDFFSKTISLADGQEVQLQLWDIAGQERFSAMSPIYYRNADACVIVFDLNWRQSFDEVLRWKESLSSHAEDYLRNTNRPFPILLMGNKADLPRAVKQQSIDQTVKEGFLGFAEVSAKVGTNVQEAFRSIAIELVGSEFESATSGTVSLVSAKADSGCVLCKEG